mmetsp:Transcript_76035/g.217799  ORF Transcript_76035/g.217799 Transcript_76035/m.217799 type:complete len:229 (-) Transcript_76035:86-772(-)
MRRAPCRTVPPPRPPQAPPQPWCIRTPAAMAQPSGSRHQSRHRRRRPHRQESHHSITCRSAAETPTATPTFPSRRNTGTTRTRATGYGRRDTQPLWRTLACTPPWQLLRLQPRIISSGKWAWMEGRAPPARTTTSCSAPRVSPSSRGWGARRRTRWGRRCGPGLPQAAATALPSSRPPPSAMAPAPCRLVPWVLATLPTAKVAALARRMAPFRVTRCRRRLAAGVSRG